jgi:hypothetical protein
MEVFFVPHPLTGALSNNSLIFSKRETHSSPEKPLRENT